ncbi:MAG: alpha amylase C-terminal domain-containing protein, partial [Bifidobacteriaceae bacterium]|nr:alpha amylase C-terminal domain-containing protein [Bifidobacteriaceae bacterium]
YLREDPVNRKYHHGEITFSMVYAFSENYILPLSHDEVVHGKGSLYSKMPGDHWQKMAGLRSLFAYQWSHPGKQLLFMGSEFGQEVEWGEGHSLDWWLLDLQDRAGLASLVKELNAVYRSHPALWTLDSDPGGFEWIDSNDGNRNTLAYIRKSPDGQMLVAVVNFAGTPHEGYRLALPKGGRWKEILNTDAPQFGGSGVGNLGAIEAEDLPWYGRPASASVRVPPLGAVWFEPET